MADQQRRTGHGRSRERASEPALGKAVKRGFGRIPARQAVFTLDPTALYSFLDMDEEQEHPETETGEEADEILEEEADLDDRDDDELVTEDEPGEWYSNRYLARLRESFEFAGLPVLDLGHVHSISITERGHCQFACSFQEPNWFQRAMDSGSEAGPYIKRLARFMHALSEWFDECRQSFLADPTAEHFVTIDADYRRNPVVLQSGLLARVNARLSEYYRLSEQDFSRLADKIWLLWAEWNMPLRQLFSKQFRTEWVIQGCLQRHRDTGRWMEELSKGFTKEDLSKAKRKDFGNLTLEEMFRVLCDIGDVNPKQTLKLVAKKIQEGEGNGS